jgi:DNA-binding NtrC family response regulator
MTLRDVVQRAAEALAPFQRIRQSKEPQILVIDNDEIHRSIICKVAARAGFLPIQAKDCGDVVRQTLLNEFDCATIDMSLGEREGAEVLLHFSICKFGAPVQILSGAESEVTAKGYELGRALGLTMMEPLRKPVELGVLREQLGEVAQHWRDRRTTASAA